ncbi:hypothetical protein HU200_055523 [Digitaria exilis]|uniref:Protein kinase domain-containing protein n=1 Tax=Digitaria exilis TaxID=1010633 RepID=A0A835AI76_9POAL|nr:hypothetical protein HU200_055523 [Digitaria exilis]
MLLRFHVSNTGGRRRSRRWRRRGRAAGLQGRGDQRRGWNASAGYCGWEGVRCGRRQRVVALSLYSYGFAGTLSPVIGNLTFLQVLNLSSNWFHGTIPASVGRLVRLKKLELSYNSFSGALPANLSSCDSLLLGNRLTSLRVLSYENNSFTGAIPRSIGNISSLKYLDLSTNQLEGLIPLEFGSLGGLQFLVLYDNILSNVLPHSLYNLSSLTYLEVRVNMLSGTIAADIGDMFSRMEVLSFSDNRFSGAIPPSLSNLSGLTRLGLAGNGFSGYYLNDNRLEANDGKGWEFITFLTNCSQLQHLVLGNNSFSDKLPNSIANLSTTLQALYLGDNNIYGSIPSNIGAIPESIGKLENLVVLALYNNLTRLNNLFAYYGNLEGPIPTSLGNLKNLFVLDLSTNRLNGSIPREVLKLPQLSFYLDLSNNSLSGPLPTEVGSLVNLNQLLLSGNQFSGTIPDSLGNCILWGSIPQSLKNLKGLALLNLTMNKLSGSIPDALLAHNNLSGLIPTVLQNLTLLSKLYLSFNDLQGEVPKGGVFANATRLSIGGNDELCGGNPQLHLAPCSTAAAKKNKKELSRSLVVTIASICALIFLGSAVALIYLFHKRLRQRKENQLISTVIDEQHERVSYQALANGAGRFSDVNLLGQGSYGAVYKCNLHEMGIIAAVKVFNIQQSGSTRSFVAECETLRRVRHRCLVKIITCCSSIDPLGQEFKALVFEFMLRPSSKIHTLSNTLSLARRLDIAVDIMDALDYLHNQCQPPIIHCDVKPSNILLAEDMSARVGDFGISKILPDNTSTTLLNSISFTGLRGSIGYVAPGNTNS